MKRTSFSLILLALVSLQGAPATSADDEVKLGEVVVEAKNVHQVTDGLAFMPTSKEKRASDSRSSIL